MNGNYLAGTACRHLLEALADPRRILELGPADWDALIPLARAAELLPRLAAALENRGLDGRLTPKARAHLVAAKRLAAHRQQKILWELDRLERALRNFEAPVLLLKGAGYLVGGLTVGQGRLFRDVDLLVPRSRIGEIERLLREGGWKPAPLDRYDERYYRQWMHEIPPLRHPERYVEVDVHHSILPPTGRIRVDPALLLEAAMPVSGCPFKVPAPADMVLHSAAHLFFSGEYRHGLRDLSDLDLLLREFGRGDPGFWDRLAARSGELNLERALFYGLRYTQRLLATPVPAGTAARVSRFGPAGITIRGLDAIFQRAFAPDHPAAVDGWTAWARALFSARCHWLRMPPALLLYHFFHKAVKGRKTGVGGSA
jgi:hypothetical protein